MMRESRLLLGMMVLAAVLVGGCAGTQSASQSYQAGTAWPLDSLNYLYTDPVANSPVDDNPVYSLASGSPALFGYTPEDAALHSQRPNRSYGVQ
jgi:hypothetical protein